MEVLKKYTPNPDYRNIVLAATNHAAPRLPLYEHLIAGKAMLDTTGTDPTEAMESPDAAERDGAFASFWNFWREMGYDTASMEGCVCSILPGGGALGGHKEGVIKCREDFERYPWDELPDRYFQRFDPMFESLRKTCPAGMKAVGGVGNGIFEAVQDLVGYMDLCFLRSDDPELYEALFQKMGDTMAAIWRRFLRSEYSDVFCVGRFGDDLGFKTSTLLPTEDIKRLILPQYKRVIQMVHQSGKPFLLHSCGNLFSVFDDLIRETGIDAKHSNEDDIAHFSVWVRRYGDRIGNFGGVDTNVLCQNDEAYIRSYVTDCLEKVKNGGGVAFGSGNSIPDYVPTSGYLTMVDTVRSWRGE